MTFDVGTIVAPIIIGITIGAISGGLAVWVSFRRFQEMDEQREEDWTEWRRSINKRLDSHAKDIKEAGSFKFRLERLEKKVNGQ